jgi:thioredoxin reductase
MEEALFLTKFAKSVTVLNRSSKLRASKVSIPSLPSPSAYFLISSQVMQQRAQTNSKIRLLTNRVVNRWLGTEKTLEAVEVKDIVKDSLEQVLLICSSSSSSPHQRLDPMCGGFYCHRPSAEYSIFKKRTIPSRKVHSLNHF